MTERLEHELIAHATTLRRLAADLVGGNDADDLVQETALHALRAPQREGHSLAGFFASILRHLASKHRRGERRRRERELRAARPESLPPHDVALSHHETVRRLTEALVALPEPYRGALLSRYYEGITPAAIAAQRGEPLATVKSRLQRGLAMLRERLDRDADGSDWRGALVSAFGLGDAAKLGTAASAVAATTGVIVMGTGVKLAIGGAAALAAVAASFFLVGGEPAPSARNVAASSRSPAPATDGTVATQQNFPERRELTNAVGSATLGARIHGRCVDEQGTPLAGVKADFSAWPANSQRVDAWTMKHDVPQEVHETKTTQDDGTFEFLFEPLPPFQFMVSLTAAKRAPLTARWFQLASGSLWDLGNVTIANGTVVRGRVVDTSGDPVAGAELELRNQTTAEFHEGRPELADSARAAAQPDGTFVACGALPAGTFAVQVYGRDVERPKSLMVANDQRDLTVDIVVAKLVERPALRGIVVDVTGAPLANISVGSNPFSDGKSVRTDRAGHFCVLKTAYQPDEVHLNLEGDGLELVDTTETFAWGRSDLKLTMVRALDVEVLALDALTGTPVEDYQVRIVPVPGYGSRGNDYSVRAHGKHLGGRVVVGGVRRGKRFVVVEPQSEDLATSAFTPIEVADPGPARVTVRLPHFAQRSLTVRRVDGTPVVGDAVLLGDPLGLTPSAPLQLRELSNWGGSRGSAVQVLSTTTDTKGQATLRGPSGRRLAVFLPGPGHAPSVTTDVDLDAAEPLVITVNAGARLIGTVTPPEMLVEMCHAAGFESSAAVAPELRRVLPSIGLTRQDDGSYQQFPDNQHPSLIASDGTFSVDDIPSGTWAVRVCWFRKENSPGRIGQSEQVAVVTIADGVTATLNVDLSHLLPGELDANVQLNGEPLRTTNLRVDIRVGFGADGKPREVSENVQTDADGHFHLRARGGEYRVWCMLDRGCTLHAAESAVVTAGACAIQTFHLLSSPANLRVVDASGKPVGGVSLLLQADGREWQQPVSTGTNGTSKCRLEPANYTAYVLPKQLQDGAAIMAFLNAHRGEGDALAAVRMHLGEVTVKQGATTEVEFRLPPDWDR
jgi:RNA polymerase sigma factor (sigma-70 family)